MRINNISEQSFKGFKNPIVNHLSNDIGSVSIMSLQLTNEGERDLDKIKELRNLKLMSDSIDKNSDVMNVVLIHNNFNTNDKLIFDSNNILLCDDLNRLRKDSGERFALEYLAIEKSVLKQCTFLANITKRMMGVSALTNDLEMAKVISYTQQLFEKIFKTKDDAFAFLLDSLKKNQEHQVVAAKINEIIANNMAKFFRV